MGHPWFTPDICYINGGGGVAEPGVYASCDVGSGTNSHGRGILFNNISMVSSSDHRRISERIDPGSRQVYPPHSLYKWRGGGGWTRGLWVLRCRLSMWRSRLWTRRKPVRTITAISGTNSNGKGILFNNISMVSFSMWRSLLWVGKLVRTTTTASTVLTMVCA
jgi:hypothetical protein